MVPSVVIAAFEKPTTEDFVWSNYFKIGPVGVNLIVVLVLATLLVTLAFFYFALRKPSVVPSKLQMMAESGVDFIRNGVIMEVIGPDGLVYMPLFVAIFFYILFGNLFEVMPFLNTTMNSRIMFPLILALPIWVVYNGAGIKKHGFFGYLKLQTIPSGVPLVLLILTLLPVIEFFSNILVRPITLAIRLFANMMAGHFLLALVFGATIATATAGNAIIVLSPIPFAFSVILIAFEIFVSVLQAFIFVVLSATYIQGAIASEH